ncbi:uncharacterized protein LOC131687518 [Topomyia yanbarensis]|uniref:uncharacterized protein LOC131687518 n=1 Tax=Topomyia yanbarensis TaxID=2498891 RepID=UPI00273AE1C1|nr:uncharacterized protein LOC131687518 [Topomyia yanbarensis]
MTLVIQAVRNNWSSIEKHTTIKDEDTSISLIDFNLSSSYFAFRGAFYRQKSGTAMGNPLSPALADLVMETLLDHVLETIDIPIPFLRKYVDDLVTALPADKIQHVQSALNAYNPHIQFTCEIESNNRLPYLDMVLIRTNEQKIQTDWYRKPVASGRILNYLSFQPLTQKLNTAMGFIARVFRLSTCKSEIEKKQMVREYLRNNNYPSGLINRLINRIINQQVSAESERIPESEKMEFRSLHHVDGLTPALSKIIQRNHKNVSLSFKCTKTISSLFTKLKDPTSEQSKRNVIYRIPCSDCESSYVGLTTQQLKQRLAGHRSLIKRYNDFKSSNCERETGNADEFKKTALMVHMIEKEHSFDLSRTKILDHDNRLPALQILEMCHIFSDGSTINFRTDTNNLNAAYSGVLHSLSH